MTTWKHGGKAKENKKTKKWQQNQSLKCGRSPNGYRNWSDKRLRLGWIQVLIGMFYSLLQLVVGTLAQKGAWVEILIFAATGNESTGIRWGQPHNMLLCVPVCACVLNKGMQCILWKKHHHICLVFIGIFHYTKTCPCCFVEYSRAQI